MCSVAFGTMSDVAALLNGVDLDSHEKVLEGVMKPVVKSSVVTATVRDHTQVIRKLVQVRVGAWPHATVTCGVVCVSQLLWRPCVASCSCSLL